MTDFDKRIDLDAYLSLEDFLPLYNEYCKEVKAQVAKTMAMIEGKIGLEERYAKRVLSSKNIYPHRKPIVMVDFKDGLAKCILEGLEPDWTRNELQILLRNFTKKGTPAKTGLNGYPAMNMLNHIRLYTDGG